MQFYFRYTFYCYFGVISNIYWVFYLFVAFHISRVLNDLKMSGHWIDQDNILENVICFSGSSKRSGCQTVAKQRTRSGMLSNLLHVFAQYWKCEKFPRETSNVLKPVLVGAVLVSQNVTNLIAFTLKVANNFCSS